MAAEPSSIQALSQLVDMFSKPPSLTAELTERQLGIELGRSGDSNSYFTVWTHGGFRLGALTVQSLELREPVQRSGATAGSSMILTMAPGDCLSRSDVRGAFPAIELSDVPRGRAAAEPAYWSDMQDGVKRSFGFAQPNPDCLKTVVLTAG